jgi:hypothetical protein
VRLPQRHGQQHFVLGFFLIFKTSRLISAPHFSKQLFQNQVFKRIFKTQTFQNQVLNADLNTNISKSSFKRRFKHKHFKIKFLNEDLNTNISKSSF